MEYLLDFFFVGIFNYIFIIIDKDLVLVIVLFWMRIDDVIN